MTHSKQIFLYTDGACRGNPGPGGYGAILRYGKHVKEVLGAYPETTNNQMELLAVIKGLEMLNQPCKVHVTTDSKYVLDGFTRWLPDWKKNGWQRKGRKEIKNLGLWRELDRLGERHRLEWSWVKGHSGDPQNERADQLANEAIDAFLEGRLLPDSSLEILLGSSS
jgi:ribonuclease HI